MNEYEVQALQILREYRSAGYPKLPVIGNTGQAGHHWHMGWVRDIASEAGESFVVYPDGFTQLGLRLYELYEKAVLVGYVAGPGYIHKSHYGYRPYWWDLTLDEKFGTDLLPNWRQGYPTPSGYAVPGAVSIAASPPTWFPTTAPAPTRQEWETVLFARLHPDDYYYLASIGVVEEISSNPLPPPDPDDEEEDDPLPEYPGDLRSQVGEAIEGLYEIQRSLEDAIGDLEAVAGAMPGGD